MGRNDAESETLIPIGGFFDVPEIAPCLTQNYGKQPDNSDTGAGPMLIPIQSVQAVRDKKQTGIGIGDPGDEMYTLTGRDQHAIAFAHQTAGDHTTSMPFGVDFTPTLKAGPSMAVAFANTAGDTALGLSKPGVPPITGRNGDPGNVFQPGMAVRRLTPTECERLQGFPDSYTLVPYRNKPAADGNRYKALGNSMAVPVMAWIGQRIAQVSLLGSDVLRIR